MRYAAVRKSLEESKSESEPDAFLCNFHIFWQFCCKFVNGFGVCIESAEFFIQRKKMFYRLSRDFPFGFMFMVSGAFSVIFFPGRGFASPFRPATAVFLSRRTVR